MTSFFQKLKRGMGIEEFAEDPLRPRSEANEDLQERPAEEKIEKKLELKPKKKKPEKLEIKAESIEPVNKKQEGEEKEIKEEVEKSFLVSPIVKAPEDKEKQLEPSRQSFAENLGEPEGQLAVDVYQTEKDLVIQSAIAGVKPENLDVTIEGDLITIKGVREKLFEGPSEDYFSQECYWGSFSREIILPVEVDHNQTTAEMKEGILTIRIPKVLKEKKRRIEIK